MLTSTVIATTTTSSVVSSAVSSASAGIVSLTTPVGLHDYGVIAVIALILALIANELLVDTEKWNKTLSNSFTMSIVPLLVAFVSIVVFKISEII